ncbi:cation diffusion facilitator family transporter [Mycoplasma sp. CAG:776]|nr:cation diffusion facilitator family transporter [Mycoplasma sp. CAG:776]
MNRYESTKKVSFLGIVGNIFLLVIKFIVAVFSHSEAMMADAINSAGDIFSSIMSYIGNKIAGVPSDEDHNFGHGKAEYIFSMFISIFMILVGMKILFDSVIAIVKGDTFQFSIYLIIVCLVTILVKFFLYLYAKRVFLKHQNILVKATMKDHRNDILLTTGTLLSVILGYFGYYFFDGIFGSITSIYIIFTGIGIMIEAYRVLMDASISKDEKDLIIHFILENSCVIRVEDFYTVPVGYKYVIVLTIDLDGNLSTFASHEIADLIEKELIKKFKKIYKVIIHVNPVEKK